MCILDLDGCRQCMALIYNICCIIGHKYPRRDAEGNTYARQSTMISFKTRWGLSHATTISGFKFDCFKFTVKGSIEIMLTVGQVIAWRWRGTNPVPDQNVDPYLLGNVASLHHNELKQWYWKYGLHFIERNVGASPWQIILGNGIWSGVVATQAYFYQTTRVM